jgi:hypothetical protein
MDCGVVDETAGQEVQGRRAAGEPKRAACQDWQWEAKLRTNKPIFSFRCKHAHWLASWPWHSPSPSLTLALTVTVTRLYRAEILNNQSCARYSMNDAMACGVYGFYGRGRGNNHHTHSLAHSLTQRSARLKKIRESSAVEDGEGNRINLRC